MPHVELNGQKIFYEDTGGTGKPVILGHGFLMDHEMFDPQVAVLSDAYRVIRFDERGFGQTVTDGKPFTLWDSAADCIGLLDHLGIDKATVGGMSQGGYLALRAALSHPDRVQALVLMATQAGIEDKETNDGYLQLFESWAAQGPIDSTVNMLAGVILGDQKYWEPWVSRWRKIPGNSLLQPTHALLGRDDITERLAEIRCPAIVFHGDADHAVPIERGKILADKLPECKGYVVVKGAAHAANLTHPGDVNPSLRAFLDTCA